MMRFLTVQEPHASLIWSEEKTWETRSWATRYRGPLGIHAGKMPPPKFKMDEMLPLSAFQWALARLVVRPPVTTDITVLDPPGMLPVERGLDLGVRAKHLQYGKLLCVVDLVDVRRTEDIDPVLIQTELPFGDFSPGRYGWKLANLRRLEKPVEIDGHQRLWTNLWLEAAVKEQLHA